MVIDYAIPLEDYLEYESEILLSGCLPELILPKIYRHHESMYLVYEKNDAKGIALEDDPSGYDEKEIEQITRKVKLYMLRPESIIFHPSRICRSNGGWGYHYLPTRRKLLYGADDLRRYLMLGHLKRGKHRPDMRLMEDNHSLFFKEDGRVETLFLKKTTLGKEETCNILLDFDGRVVIDHHAGITVVRGEVWLNRVLLAPNSRQELKRGDIVQFGQKEAVYI